MTIYERLTQLSTFDKDGWGETRTERGVNKNGIQWFWGLYKDQFEKDLPEPGISLTNTGNLDLEWTIGKNDICLTVNLETHYSDWWEQNRDTNVERFQYMNLELVDNWRWIVDRLRAVMETTHENPKAA